MVRPQLATNTINSMSSNQKMVLIKMQLSPSHRCYNGPEMIDYKVVEQPIAWIFKQLIDKYGEITRVSFYSGTDCESDLTGITFQIETDENIVQAYSLLTSTTFFK